MALPNIQVLWEQPTANAWELLQESKGMYASPYSHLAKNYVASEILEF